MVSDILSKRTKPSSSKKVPLVTAPPNELTEKFTTIKTAGINIITCSDGVNRVHARLAIEHQLILGESIAGLQPLTGESLTCIVTGSKNKADFEDEIRKKTKKPESFSTFNLCEKPDYLFLSDEGVGALSANMEHFEGSYISLSQSLLSLTHPDQLNGLHALKELAIQYGKTFFIFTVERGFDEKRLGEVTYDNQLHVSNCIPDPNAVFACAVQCPTLTNLFGENDLQQTFIQGRWINGIYRISSRRFTGADPTARRMWKMANGGASIDELAIEFERNKSNISRALQKLPRLDSKAKKEIVSQKSI